MSMEDQSGDSRTPSSPLSEIPAGDRSPFDRFKSDVPASVQDEPSHDPRPEPELDEAQRTDLARLSTLDPAVISLWREYALVALLSALVVGGGAYLLRQIDAPGWIWMGVSAVAVAIVVGAVLSFATIAIRYRQWRWSLDPQRLYVEKGVFIHSTMLVPRNRIQNVTTEAGPLQRRHGLTTLTIHTAGMRSPNVEIPALSDEVAQQIRTELGHL
ncbi:MAG: PH domain-containing protein [Acidimicrobiia bacterium]|nr:PH domain-containing protein [Acidimicrobiia bacterium]